MTARLARLLTAVLAACALALLAGAGARAQGASGAKPAWSAEVDRVFAEWDRADSPGCALALIKDGAIVYERGYGTADLEHDVPIRPETVFYVGSLSKQFTAMAAALAIGRHRLALDDDVRRYLPELPDYGTPITVRHLIHHTSGLRDVNTLVALAGRRDEDAWDNDAVLRLVSRQKALNFRPGDEYLYSNSGYAMLALVVERATGVPFATFADANIFRPLGLSVTHFHTDVSRLVKNRAYAYQRGAGGEMRLNTPQNERAGAGGLFTNVRDLAKWDENFYTGRVGGLEVIRQLETPGRLNDGTSQTYAWGLMIGRYRGLPIVEHGGSLGGYRAHLIRFRGQHFSVACLCNLASINPSQLARRVADIYLGKALGAPEPQRGGQGTGQRPAPPRLERALSARELAEYAGTYSSEELDATYQVLIEGGALAVRRGVERQARRLIPAARDEFGLAGGTLHFTRGAGGTVEGFTLDAGRVRGIRFDRVAGGGKSPLPGDAEAGRVPAPPAWRLNPSAWQPAA